MRLPDPVVDGRVLQRLGRADRGFYCRLYGCPDTMRHVGMPLAAAEASAAFDRVMRLLERDSGCHGYWLLPERAGGGGRVGMMALQGGADPEDAEVGVLLEPAAQRSGVATAAITALADAVFTATGLRRLWTRHARGHGAAAALMRRIGFIEVSSGPDGLCRWELGRDDWLARVPVSSMHGQAAAQHEDGARGRGG